MQNQEVPASYWYCHQTQTPRLIQVIYHKNVEQLKQILNEKPISIDIRDTHLRTPLHLAVAISSSEILHLLLLHNVIDIDSRDIGDSTPLHRAISQCSIHLVRVLLYHGADANAKCPIRQNKTPFLMAVSSNCDVIATELLEYVADFNETDMLNNIALFYTVINNSELAIEIIKRYPETYLQKEVLLLTLYYKNNSLFNYCWKRVKKSGIFIHLFCILLSDACTFPNHEWIDTIYNILQDYDLLKQENAEYEDIGNFHFYQIVFNEMGIRQIEKDQRHALVYAFLSKGIQIRGLDGYKFFEFYQFPDKEEMLHILVQGGYNVDNSLCCISDTTHPLTVMTYIRHTTFSLNDILETMLNAHMHSALFQIKSIKTLVQFCTPNIINRNIYFTDFRKRFIDHPLREYCYDEMLTNAMSTNPVPTLLELSRDEVRSIISQKYRLSYDFCCLVKFLDIPKELKQLILYEGFLPQYQISPLLAVYKEYD